MSHAVRVREIQVSGLDMYRGSAWKDGFLAYVQGIRRRDLAVCSRPKIMLNNTVLRLGSDKRYYGYFCVEPNAGPRPAVRKGDFVLTSSPEAAEVEMTLGWFARGEHIRQLIINLPNGSIALTRNRHQPHKVLISTEGLPSMTDVMRRMGYKV